MKIIFIKNLLFPVSVKLAPDLMHNKYGTLGGEAYGGVGGLGMGGGLGGVHGIGGGFGEGKSIGQLNV